MRHLKNNPCGQKPSANDTYDVSWQGIQESCPGCTSIAKSWLKENGFNVEKPKARKFVAPKVYDGVGMERGY